jgi:transcription initiation factor TFIIIB Brf1 subunit/transcription initiation factor TFIIB
MVYQEVATVCSVCKFVVKDELMNAGRRMRERERDEGE